MTMVVTLPWQQSTRGILPMMKPAFTESLCPVRSWTLALPTEATGGSFHYLPNFVTHESKNQRN